MAALLVKRGLLIGLVFLALASTITAAAIFVAGDRISKVAIDRVLEDVTGRRVVLTQPPILRFFPALTAEFRGISFHNRRYASDNFPVLNAPVMRLSFSVLAALGSQTQITGVELEQPVFRAIAEDGTWQLPLGDQSRLAKLVTDLTKSTAHDAHEMILDEADDTALGLITIKNGTVALDRSGTDLLKDVQSEFDWSSTKGSGTLKAKAIWRGEPSSVTLSIDNIISLLSGAETGLAFSLDAAPLTTRFSGTTGLMPMPYLDGAFYAKASSLQKTIEWQKIKAPFDFANFNLTVSGDLKAEPDKWQLEDSQLQLGANKGTGGLIFQPKNMPPMISGTLDFESLDMGVLAQIFALGAKTVRIDEPTLNTDLRLSAASATYGTLALNKVAASLQISKLANSLDIHNAAAFGGTLQMALKSQNDLAAKAELRILASDIDTKALLSLGGAFKDLPQAHGSLSAILKGSNIANPEFLESAEGTIKFRFGPGAIASLDANQIIRSLRKGGFFPLKAEAPAELFFNELNAEASLAQGTLQFNPLQMGLDKAALLLTGTYAVKDQSIALTGTLNLEEGHAEALNGAQTINVFFGGNLDAPLMSGLQ